MTEKEIKAQITQAHIDGYNRGYAKAKEKIADIKANCDLAIEGRDVKIMELEKENTELKSELTKKADTNHSLVEQMAKLEEENAELKEHHKGVCDVLTNTHRSLREQLSKAKELLTKWAELFKPKSGDIPPTPIQVDTEQFLKEI